MPAPRSDQLVWPDALLAGWAEFCERFGAQGSAPGDWLGGSKLSVAPGQPYAVEVAKLPALARAAGGRRPAVWCIYRVQEVPVRDAKGRLVATERIPVPLSCGAARPEAVTRYPENGGATDAERFFWCRAWDDSLPESHRWGTAPSSAAWIVGVLEQMTLPAELRAR